MAPSDKEMSSNVARLLHEARTGDETALGQLMEDCRPYLLLVANEEFPEQLQAKLNPSDLVQETFLKAHRRFPSFRGTSERELRAWLRQILRNNIVDRARDYRSSSKRAVGKEVALQDAPLAELLPAMTSEAETPSEELMRQEWREKLHRALSQLPEDSRQVIQWRNYELLTFTEIGERLGCSREVARNLWAKSLQLLTSSITET